MFKSVLVALVLLVSVATAQEPTKPIAVDSVKSDGQPTNQIAGGVLNGKAKVLPKPIYPTAARAVGADGPVTVQVLIDENGDVVSATAINGHPTLRAAATEAARQAKFSPTLLSGHPVKVNGVITYNFVGPMYPARIGFSLAFAERTGSFDANSNPAYLASSLPADWTQEKEMLNGLTFEKPLSRVEPEAPATGGSESVTKDANRYTVAISGSASVGPPRKLDARSMGVLREAIPLLATRLSISESAAWSFELGQALAELAVALDDKENVATSIATIEDLVHRVPTTVSPSAIARLRNFVETGKAPDPNLAILRHNIPILANFRY